MHGLIALLPILFGLGGGWVGLATAGLQFGTTAIKQAPAIIQGVERLKHCNCVMQVQARPAKWNPRQPYGPMRMIRP